MVASEENPPNSALISVDFVYSSLAVMSVVMLNLLVVHFVVVSMGLHKICSSINDYVDS